MNRPIRILLLSALLYPAQAQPSASWRGSTSDGGVLTISVVQGAVTSLTLNERVSCLTAVEEGAKVFTGPPVSISGDAIRFTGQAMTACGAIQVRLDGTLEGTKASGGLTITPPKRADSPARRRVTWTAEKVAAGR